MTAPKTTEPDPKRDRLLAIVVLGFALLPCGLGSWTVALGAQPVRTYADAHEVTTVEPPAFVRVQVTPRPETTSVLIESSSRYFLVMTEEGLLLHLPEHSDLGAQLATAFPFGSQTPDLGALAMVAQPWEVEGAVHVVGDYPRLTSNLPGYLIDDYAEEQRLPEGTRMIEVGHTPLMVMGIGAMPILCCAFPLFGLALYAFIRYRQRSKTS